ncbi:uncharacterized protein LOC111377296 [Olea europaea var. sylvestris]|uniref:uncharacterized protein LOC111377296 n=1 Tax=Olea europaea var. sylvestris TaxID=158386 RepID=UPI000C1CE26D|nr:uncharacterized protein LOC111377296 [Olea europaea var. sylvestris]
MVQEGIVLGHRVSEKGIEVDKAKIQVMEKLPPLTSVKGVRSFIGHVGFYRRFIKDFSKITKPLCNLLMKELMYDASDHAVGAVLGQRKNKIFHVIYYASRTWNDAQINYATIEKELLAVVYAFDKFRSYLVGSKVIAYTDHAALNENVVADHLSRLERDELEMSVDINEIFPDEQIFGVEIVPWYADIVNYLAKSIPPPEGTNQIIRRCILEDEVPEILEHCHSSAYAGHFGASKTAAKILQSVVALPTNDTKVVIEFLKKYIFTRYGTPRAIISDGGEHFINRQLEQLLNKYRVKHKVAIPYHPQTNGQVEVLNRQLKRILEVTVNSSRKDWSKKLDDAL